MFRFTFVIVASFWMVSLPASAADNRLFADCKNQSSEILCNIRLLHKEGIKTTKASLSGTPLKSVRLKNYTGKSAWLFLIDISNPKRRRTVRANIDFIKTILDQASKMNGDLNFGVAVFAADMKIIAPLGSKIPDIKKALKKVKASGLSTELYRTSGEAIAKLEQFKADRKVLVLFSDGQAEDKAYKRSTVIQAAKKANISIFALGYTEPKGEPTYLQNLRLMAEETGGIFTAADRKTRKLAPTVIDGFLGHILNGGQIHIDGQGFYGPQKLHLELELSGGQTLQHDQTIKLPAKPVARPEVDTKTDDTKPELKESSRQSPLKRLTSWAEANMAVAIAALSAGILLILLLIWGLIRALRGKEDIAPPDGFVFDEDGELPGPVTPKIIYGWLEMLDAQMTKFDITDRSMRIGRGEDNELRLDNDSVSARHAYLYLNRDGDFMIDDLGSANKTVVNDQIIEKRLLSDGDVIKLGEVSFRFIINRQ